MRYDDQYPFGYQGGTFSHKSLETAREANIPLTLDIAIPGKCLNECVFCGYHGVNAAGKLSPSEIRSVFRQFKDLGGTSIKILGEGEPLLRDDIFGLLGDLYGLGLNSVLFTCGDVIGDDQLAKKVHGHTGHDIASWLKDTECTVVLKYDSHHEDDIVGRQGFSLLRNRALDILLDLEFNSSFPTKLGFGIVLLQWNLEEVPEIYRKALENNIYPLICPLMPIGKTRDEKYRKLLAPSRHRTHKLRDQLVRIRKEYGINSHTVSDFPGGLPCDVAKAGFYIDDAGNAFLCESDDLVGNVKEQSLVSLWRRISEGKDQKYGEARYRGLCFPKRSCGII